MARPDGARARPAPSGRDLGRRPRGGAARRHRGPHHRRSGPRSPRGSRRRDRAVDHRAPVPRAALDAAHDGPVSLWPPGRGTAGVSKRRAPSWPTSWGSIRDPSCRQLEVDILNQSAALTAPDARAGRPPTGPTSARAHRVHRPRRAARHFSELLGQQRLVTLVGPGGVGKTRVALELGQRALDVVAPTVLMVELAAVSGDDLIATVASAMANPSHRSDALVSSIGDSSLLLILDNCEHLVATCAELIDALLRSCRGLTGPGHQPRGAGRTRRGRVARAPSGHRGRRRAVRGARRGRRAHGGGR